MIFKYIIFQQGSITIINALKGQNHQHRATPCDWMTEPFRALKGRQQRSYRMTPFQGSYLPVCAFHRALPDAKCYKAFSLNNRYKLFIFSFHQNLTFHKKVYQNRTLSVRFRYTFIFPKNCKRLIFSMLQFWHDYCIAIT